MAAMLPKKHDLYLDKWDVFLKKLQDQGFWGRLVIVYADQHNKRELYRLV